MVTEYEIEFSRDTFLNLEAACGLGGKHLQNGFQVRRSVGALLAVAQGKVNIRDIKFMLEVPSRHSWLPRLRTVSALGLYLCEVGYSEEDRATFRTEAEEDRSFY